MADRKKWLALGLLGLFGLGCAATRTKGVSPVPGGPGAAVSIEVYDPEGNPVPHSSPFTLTFGVTYTVRATITNTSTLNSSPAPASLRVWLAIAHVYGEVSPTFLGLIETTLDFAAGETKVFDLPYTPGGYGEPVGESSNYIQAWVAPHDSVVALAQAWEFITYIQPPLQYGATLELGVA